MKLDEISDNLFYFLKSVYRYNKIIELNAPEIMIKLEEDLMKRRITELTPSEIAIGFSIWEEFRREAELADINADKLLEIDFEKLKMAN